MNELLIATQKASGITEDLDPNYNLVSLHLRGDVNTGRDYNAFSDASSNNFRLTNNGDVRGSSFSPYGTSWSNLFNGSSYLSAGTTLFNYTTGNASTTTFTIEAFIYLNSYQTAANIFHNPCIIGKGDVYLNLGVNGSGNLIFYHYDGTVRSITGSSVIPLATWTHVAVTVTGGIATLYVNGASVGSGTWYGIQAAGQNTTSLIGRASTNASSLYINGYISNLRVSTVARTIATPTTAYTNDANTALLTAQSNRFIDNSSSPITLTITGAPTVSSFSPFLDADTTSGSGYFDGNADDLSIATNAAFTDLPGDWTIECWFYSTSTSGQSLAGTSSFNSSGFFLELNYTAAGRVSFVPVPWGNRLESSSSVFTINTWNHIAFVRSGTTVTIYVNGTSVASGTRSVTSNSQPLTIGQAGNGWDARYYFNGYISDFRIVKGAAVYTGAFTPPTKSLARSGAASASAYPSTTNVNTTFAESATSLLTLQERGAYNTIGFQDESEYQHIITRTNNVAQGTFSPFSQAGWAVNFGGGSSNINLASSADFALGGAFSFECWVYQTSIPNFVDLLDVRTSNEVGSLGISATGFPRWQNGPSTGSLVTGSTALTLNQWNYLLFVADASGCSIYLNGQRIANTAQVATWPTSARPCFIGGSFGNASGGSLSGFIADARLIKGSTPYSSTATSVTVPTALLPFVTNTVLQCCRTNRFANTVNSASMTANGTTSITAFSPFKPPAYDSQVHGGSGFFDGTGDYLTVTSADAFDMAGDFTVEMWVYPITLNTPTGASVFCCGNTSLFQFNTLASGTRIEWYANGPATISVSYAGYLQINQWNHLVACRTGTTMAIFVNGTRLGTATDNTSYNLSQLYLSYQPTSAHPFHGYMGGMRVIKGNGPYDATSSTLTVPSGPLPLINNTSLLLNFTNGGVIDSTGKNVIETVGNAGVVTTAIKKFGTGSMYFDGTGDYLRSPASPLFDFNTGDFTVEAWVYTSSAVAYATVIDKSIGSGGTTGWFLEWSSTRGIWFFYQGSSASAAYTVATGQWYHLAVSKSGSSLRLFVNGVQQGSTATVTADITSTYGVSVGASNGTPQYQLNGYIDDLRITKGYARYVEGTGANAGKMVFNGTNTLALPTKALPNRAVASTATTSLTAPTSVEALVVGGGGGAGGQQGGGGGAGGFREFMGGNAIAVSANNSYRITVGSSGSGGASGAGATSGTSGGSSIFSTFTSEGGGGGGTVSTSGLNGGSGGGGGHQSPGTSLGGLGNRVAGTTTVVPTQGNNGGDSNPNATNYYAGGGGGAGGVGQNGSPNNGNGGLAQTSSITGTSIYYAGGGGAGSRGGTAGLGGGTATTANKGGGGDGSASGIGLSALTNTGGGGGGGAYAYNGGNGGSGVVILAYPITNKPLTASLGLVYTIDTVTRPGYRVYKFVAGTGTISW